MGEGMLFAQMDAPDGQEEDFHDWYDEEHIPSRLAIEGIDGALRLEREKGEAPRWAVVYDIGDMGALDTPPYRRLHAEPSDRTRSMLASLGDFRRMTCELVSDSGPAPAQPYTFVVGLDVPAQDREELEQFYEEEHTLLMLQGPDWIRVRRYRVQQQDAGWTDLVRHDLASPAALEAPEAVAAREAPRRRSIANHPWFADSGKWLYRQRSWRRQ